MIIKSLAVSEGHECRRVTGLQFETVNDDTQFRRLNVLMRNQIGRLIGLQCSIQQNENIEMKTNQIKLADTSLEGYPILKLHVSAE